jgi:hypothetical protein
LGKRSVGEEVERGESQGNRYEGIEGRGEETIGGSEGEEESQEEGLNGAGEHQSVFIEPVMHQAAL